MLTIKENLAEVMKGGKPDRFVNQYEFMDIILEVPMLAGAFLQPGETRKNAWGVTLKFIEGQLGQFPVHTEDTIVLKADNITEWRKYVKAPAICTEDSDWEAAIAHVNAVDRTNKYVTVPYFGGVFEMTHYLMGMEGALMNLYEEPEAMHELIDYVVEYELEYAKAVCDRLKPDALFHHDDWGSQKSTFISPDMFKEFFLPAYKKIYAYYKSRGVELIVHHCDSYAATLVPYMIEMGIDIWQGTMTTNNNPELIKKYGGQITFMGDVDSGTADFPGWNAEIMEREFRRAVTNCGKLYFIPCLTQGLFFSSYPGAYDCASATIDKLSKEMF